MLNFRNANIIFIAGAITLLWCHMQFGFSLWWLLLLAFVYSLLLFYGSYYVGSNFFMKVLCSADTPARQIAISFDDGPADNYTAEILDVLKEKNVPAVFFCIGKNVEGREALLKQMIQEGHIVGNHSYSHHFWFDLFSTDKMGADLQRMNDEMRRATGFSPRLFRPPYGVTTPNMSRVMRRSEFTAVGWNIRSMDTVTADADKLHNKIVAAIKPGAVILLHDTCASTLQMLPRLIESARSRGFEFVRADKLLNVQAYA